MKASDTDIVKLSLDALDWQELLEKVKSHAPSELSASLISNTKLAENVAEAEHLLQQTQEMVSAISKGENIPSMRAEDVRALLETTSKDGVLTGVEVAKIGSVITTSLKLKAFFLRPKKLYPTLGKIAEGIESIDGLEREIQSSIDPDGNVTSKATPAMPSLLKEVETARERVRKSAEKLITSPKYRYLLQEDFFTLRRERYVLPLKATGEAYKAGIVHDQSQSGATVFVEPRELVRFNNRYRIAQLELSREVQKVLVGFSSRIAHYRGEIERALMRVAQLGAVYARANFSIAIKGVRPELAREKIIELRGMRHPLLLLQGFCVPNDLLLGKDFKLLIVSGPNAGGKTVVLKTFGLGVLMPQAGLFIPAEEDSRVALFKPVVADIGDPQSVTGDLSTFSGHMRNIVGILEKVASASGAPLVLLDELMVGTDPAQGASLGIAILKELALKEVLTVVTTHFDAFKRLSSANRNFGNAAMGFRGDTFAPDYKLSYGMGGRSYAFDIALKMGLSPGIVEKARQFDTSGSVKIEHALIKLEEQERFFAVEREKLKTAQMELERAKELYEGENAKLHRRKDELLKELRSELAQQFSEAKEELKNAMRRAIEGNQRLIGEARDKVTKIEKDYMEKFAPRDAQASLMPEEERKIFKKGMRVYVPSFRREGIVTNTAGRDGMLTVQIGKMKAKVKAGGISPLEQEEVQAGEITEQKVSYSISNPAMRVDLRGMRVDEALNRLTSLLDRAIIEELSPISVIHGHGTGALKKAIREYLSRSPYVRQYEPAPQDAGGDGVTVVHLK